MSILDKFEITEPKSELLKAFKGHDGIIKLFPGGWTFLPGYKKFADALATFEFAKDDVLVCTFPKSGTTWTQEIVWTMRNNPDLDPAKVTSPLHLRVPNLEADIQIEHLSNRESFDTLLERGSGDCNAGTGKFLHTTQVLSRPRTIKYHLPFVLSTPTLLDTAKVVYVIRDPRDVCLSYMHHSQLFFYETFQGTLDEYIDAFIEGLVVFGPYWAHVGQAWERRHHPNMFITFYEKLKKNPKEEYEKLNKFLDTKLTSEQLEKIIVYTSFDAMKSRKEHVFTEDDMARHIVDSDVQANTGGFFWHGIAGGWKKVFNQEQKDKFEGRIKKHCPDLTIMENILNP